MTLFSLRKFLKTTALSLLLLCPQIAVGDCSAKVEVAPAYVHLDLLESGHTVRRHDMGGVRATADVLVYGGFCVKSMFTAAWDSGHGELYTGGIGVGHCIPCPWVEKMTFTPYVGFSFTNLHTTTTIHQLGLIDTGEKFRSTAPYLGLDFTWTFCEGWRICASYQYSWSCTHTKIHDFPKNIPGVEAPGKSHSKGSAYGIALEKDLCDEWSVNVGYGYNCSLSKEKHGIRGYGIKLGVVRWF